MKKSEMVGYRMGLTEYELRGMSNARNAVRLERDGEGKNRKSMIKYFSMAIETIFAKNPM